MNAHVPVRFQAHCVFCNMMVDIRQPGVYQLQSGWVKNRKGGGANAIHLAERLPHWSCSPCMDTKLNGTNAQLEMFA